MSLALRREVINSAARHRMDPAPAPSDEAVLLARRVIVHGSPAEVLRPDNLVRAFGVDVLDRDGARTEGEDPR